MGFQPSSRMSWLLRGGGRGRGEAQEAGGAPGTMAGAQRRQLGGAAFAEVVSAAAASAALPYSSVRQKMMFGQSVQAGPGATGGTHGEDGGGTGLAATLELQWPAVAFAPASVKRLQLLPS